MTSEGLKAARKALGCSQSELAEAIRTPKRTIQDWEAGKCRLPGIVGVTMELLLQKDRWIMQGIRELVQLSIAQHHPGGIATVLTAEERGEV